MDVTEMDRKPTSSGVRNKQKQNKALAFRWKAVSWAARAQAQGWGEVGACLRTLSLEKRGGDRVQDTTGPPGPARVGPPPPSWGPCHPGATASVGTTDKARGGHLPHSPEMASPHFGGCAVPQFKQNPCGTAQP